MTEAFESALRLLTRREHGQQELLQKLMQKGFNEYDVSQAISECQRLGYQDEKRFVHMMIKMRMGQGYGSMRIIRELKEKKVDLSILSQAISEYDDEEWNQKALEVFIKKYKSTAAVSPKERQKQQQFLLYRGFSLEQIKWVMRHEECRN